jgi:hypothetical protein
MVIYISLRIDDDAHSFFVGSFAIHEGFEIIPASAAAKAIRRHYSLL